MSPFITIERLVKARLLQPAPLARTSRYDINAHWRVRTEKEKTD